MTRTHVIAENGQSAVNSLSGEENSPSRQWEEVLSAYAEKPDESLSPHLDRWVTASVAVVVDSILSRTLTNQAKDLKKLNKHVGVLFRRFQLDSKSSHQIIWLIGHLSAQLDMLTQLEDSLELEVDKQLVGMIDAYKHAPGILRILHENPQLSQGELAKALNIKRPALSNALGRIQKYRLVISDKHGRNKYYTLTATGKKLHNHLKLRDFKITPDTMTVYLQQMLANIQKAQAGSITQHEAVCRSRQFFRLCTVAPREMERQLHKTIECARIKPNPVYKCFAVSSNSKTMRLYKNEPIIDVSFTPVEPWGDRRIGLPDETRYLHNKY